LHTEMVVSKEKLVHIALPGRWMSSRTFGRRLRRGRAGGAAIADGFDVLFRAFPGPDTAGHQSGWMSPVYLGTVAHTDEAVAHVGGARRRRTAGRHADPRDERSRRARRSARLIAAGGYDDPWLVAGPRFPPRTQLSAPVTVYDTAATAAWALGPPLPADMAGRPALEAFGVDSVGRWAGSPLLAFAPKVPFSAFGPGGRVECLDRACHGLAGLQAEG
jgi:hypothetical protein